MNPKLRWRDHLNLNILWLGINIEIGSITPLILPYLVALFVPGEQKNTYLAIVRVISLAVAMLVQPVAGLLSDRNTHRLGRRRPYILAGTLLNLVFLLVIGISPSFIDSPLDETISPLLGVPTAYVVLLIGIILVQASANVALGALIGLIPDLVPDDQRGQASGIKSVLELVPAFLIILVGPWVDQGHVWRVIGLIMGAVFVTMLITVKSVHETPLEQPPTGDRRDRILRLMGLTAIFVISTQTAVWLVNTAGSLLIQQGTALWLQIAIVGSAGLLGMTGSILIGVYFGAWVGIGAEAREQKSFIWWVVNRLLFLAAVGSIQGFAFFYLQDYIKAEDPASMTTILLAFVGVFLIPSALAGGYFADRIGRKRLVRYSGLIAFVGNIVLLFAPSLPVVIVSGCIIGMGTGLFWATNWALGTDLVPKDEAGRFLGISNLAGAGAGIVGVGIGGPIADFFNGISTGLGYLVIFSLYAFLFGLSVIVLRNVHSPDLALGIEPDQVSMKLE
jgi:MFS family permease